MCHYKKEDLELFRNGQMSLIGRIIFKNHLRDCPECTRSLEELKDDDEMIAQIRGSIQIFKDLS